MRPWYAVTRSKTDNQKRRSSWTSAWALTQPRPPSLRAGRSAVRYRGLSQPGNTIFISSVTIFHQAAILFRATPLGISHDRSSIHPWYLGWIGHDLPSAFFTTSTFRGDRRRSRRDKRWLQFLYRTTHKGKSFSHKSRYKITLKYNTCDKNSDTENLI